MAIITATTGSKDISLPSSGYSLCANIAGASLTGWLNASSFPAGLGSTVFPWCFLNGNTAIRLGLLTVTQAGGVHARGSARRLDADGVSSATGTTTITTATNWFLAMTADFNQNGTKNLLIYVNAVLEGTTNVASWTGNLDAAACQSGSIGSFGNGTAFFDGTLDDMRFYTRVLSQAEITGIYTARGRDSDLNGIATRYSLNEAASGAATGAGSVIERTRLANATPNNSPTYTSAIAHFHR